MCTSTQPKDCSTVTVITVLIQLPVLCLSLEYSPRPLSHVTGPVRFSTVRTGCFFVNFPVAHGGILLGFGEGLGGEVARLAQDFGGTM